MQMIARHFWVFFLPLFGSGLRVFKVSSIKDGFSIKNSDPEAVPGIPNEDAFYTVPLGLVLADGVGSDLLAADIYAQSLSLYLAHLFMNSSELLNYQSNSDGTTYFEEQVLKYTRWSINNFNDKLGNALLNKLEDQSNISSRIKKVSLTQNAATVVAIYLDNSNRGDSMDVSLKIFQKGDSLVMVFNPEKIIKGGFGFSFFAPKLVLKEQIHEFNVPHQFVNTDLDLNSYNSYQADVNAGSIVVAGSDGLFDNLSLGFISYLVHLISFEIAVNNITEAQMQALVQTKVKLYIEKIEDNAQVFEMYHRIRKAAKAEQSGIRWLIGLLRGAVENLIREEPIENRAMGAFKRIGFNFDYYLSKNLMKSISEMSDKQINNNQKFIEFAKKINARNVDSFFECSLEDIFFEPSDYSQAQEILSGCVMSSIMSAFPLSDDLISTLSNNFDSSMVSKAISLAAKTIAEKRLMNVIPYNIREFKDAIARGVFGATQSRDGRFDDITIVAAIVRAESTMSVEFKHGPTIQDELKFLQTIWNINFVKAIDNEFNELDTKIDERRQQILSHWKEEHGEKITATQKAASQVKNSQNTLELLFGSKDIWLV